MIFKNLFKGKNLYLLLVTVVLLLGTFLTGYTHNQTITEKLEKAEIQNALDKLYADGIIITGEKDFPDFPRWIMAIEKSISILSPATQEIILKKSPTAHRLLIIEFIKDPDTG